MSVGDDMVRDVLARNPGHPLRVAITVFVDTPMDVARARGIARDADALGGDVAAGTAFDQRYHAACRIYLDEVDPRARATRVLPGIDSLLPKGDD